MGYDGNLKFDTSVDVKGFTSGISKLKNLATNCVSTVTKVFATAVAAVSAGLVTAGTAAVKAGIEFESAFAGVKKTVDATDEELDTLRQSLLDMSAEIPQTAEALAGIAEAAGQLGIKTENLESFTEVMANLGVATNMTSEEAATALARLANIMGMPQTSFDRLGSTIVALGNNLATTESEIVDMSLRLAGAGKQIGMSETEIMAFSGAMSSLGIESEMGGSAMSTFMSKMALAVENGGESLEAFSDVAGMSAEEFKKAFKTNASQAIVAFLKGLDKIDKEGGSAIAVLNEMKFNEVRIRDVLLRSSSANEIFSESLELSANAWEENNALTKEAEARYETLESKIQLMKNGLTKLGIAFKDSMDDKLRSAIDTGIGYVNRLSEAFTDGGLEGAIEEAGRIFGELATKLAASAPDILKAAVDFIEAFAQGIRDNKDKVLQAAKEIVQTMKDTLLDLLPESIRRPVESMTDNLNGALKIVAEAFTDAFDSDDIGDAISGVAGFIADLVKIITDFVKSVAPSFSEALETVKKAFGSSGFRKGVRQAKEILKIFGDTAAKVAKAVLPIFSKAVETIVKNLDKVIPLLEAAVTVFAGFKTAATAAKTVGTLTTALSTAKTKAVGLFELLAAHPFVALASAVGTAAAGLAVFFAKTESGYNDAMRLKESTDAMNNSMEKAREASENLGEALNMDDAFDRWGEKLSNAKSSLDSLEESAIIDPTIKAQLNKDMEDTQAKIWEIASRYSTERRNLTTEEIEELQNLYDKMAEYSAQQVKLMSQYQNVAEDRANIFIDNFSGTGTEYLEQVQGYIKGANEAYSKQKEAIESAYSQGLLRVGNGTYISEDERANDRQKVIDNYNAQLKEAEEVYNRTINVLNNGYNAQNDIRQTAVTKVTKISQQYKQIIDQAVLSIQNAQEDYEAGSQEHAKRLAEIEKRKSDDIARWANTVSTAFSEAEKEEFAGYIQMIRTTQQQGGKLDEKTTEIIVSVADSFSMLPKETRDNMGELYTGVMEIYNSLPQDVKDSTSQMINAVRNTIASETPHAEDVSEEMERKIVTSTVKGMKMAADGADGIFKVTESIGLKIPQIFQNTVNDRVKRVGVDIMLGLTDGMKSQIGAMESVVESIGVKIPATFKDILGIASPSKVMKKLFRYVVDGCVLGITENQNKVIKSATDMASDTIKCIDEGMGGTVMKARVALSTNTDGIMTSLKDKLANSELTARLKAFVVAETSSLSRVMTGRSINNADTQNDSGKSKINASGNVHATINIDGREVAVAIAPFIDEELGFS